ncbi:sn-glycerol-3-phosphate ABC transporter ATP-binding protein UgpC [Marinomonas sp. THO17]|uniref:ABC transporter ATP-binding protein n=1 Tax=Marinomonas sp. THO17 TaxID=3149048 RepID=UPI00336BD6D0
MHDVNIDIDKGEFVALVGPSGCGKSTLLRLLSGLEEVSSGEIFFDDEKVNGLPPAQREIAMVFQSYALYPHMNVYKNLSFGLENLSMEKEEIKKRITAAAKMLDLEPYLDRKPKALSGGQRQRVAIGRAIVRNPRVFLFDEPLSNLDAKLRVQTRSELTRLHKKLATTMIYVTHDQIEAMTMAQKIVVVNQGRVEQVGKPLELFERPANKFVAEFIGSPKMNMFPAKITDIQEGQLEISSTALGQLSLPMMLDEARVGDEVSVGIRPSHIEVVEASDGVPFTISNIESMGHETFIYGQVPELEEEVVVHIAKNFVAEAGERLTLAFPQEFIHLFSEKSAKAFERVAL